MSNIPNQHQLARRLSASALTRPAAYCSATGAAIFAEGAWKAMRGAVVRTEVVNQ